MNENLQEKIKLIETKITAVQSVIQSWEQDLSKNKNLLQEIIKQLAKIKEKSKLNKK